DNLEDKGYTASEIKEKISQYREILMDNGSKPPPVPTDEFGRVMSVSIVLTNKKKSKSLTDSPGTDLGMIINLGW
ncbi:Protein of unknown function, partial [Cotesia congregata]